jgi:cytoskeletal protein CcmA (bactofilin family)
MAVTTKTVHDLKISGSGSASGGTYNTVSISGSGRIHGDVECRSMHLSGSGSINGKINAESIHTSGSSAMKGDVEALTIKTSGSSKFSGNVTAKELRTSGSSSFQENLNCQYLRTSGSTRIEGKINGGDIKTSGSLRVGRDCEVENFKATGSVKINGLLNADEVKIEIDFASSIKEIGGERIIVKEHDTFDFFKKIVGLFFRKSGYLQVDTIEGDDISLEVTKAKLVRGKNVVIGKDCEIEKVEYSGRLDLQENAKVREKVKI